MSKFIRHFIIFLIRIRFGVKEYELFRFPDQISKNAVYYFTKDGLHKTWLSQGDKLFDNGVLSNVSLNWMLNDQCKIDILTEEECL